MNRPIIQRAHALGHRRNNVGTASLPVLSLERKSYAIPIYIQKEKETYFFVLSSDRTMHIAYFPFCSSERTTHSVYFPFCFQTEQCTKSFSRFASNCF
jgi:dipeptidase